MIDALLADAKITGTPLDGVDGLLNQMTKAVIERALAAEITHDLGYERDDPAGVGTGNSRNGFSTKTIATTNGPITIDVPRDRNGTFEPKIVPKRARRLGQIDEMILSLVRARVDPPRHQGAATRGHRHQHRGPLGGRWVCGSPRPRTRSSGSEYSTSRATEGSVTLPAVGGGGRPGRAATNSGPARPGWLPPQRSCRCRLLAPGRQERVGGWCSPGWYAAPAPYRWGGDLLLAPRGSVTAYDRTLLPHPPWGLIR